MGDMKLPFGKHKGMMLEQCPNNYLEWVSINLIDGDFHRYAIAAKKILISRVNDSKYNDLEKEADDFLRQHNINPEDYR